MARAEAAGRCLFAPEVNVVDPFFGDAGLLRHRSDQVLRERRFWAIDSDLEKLPVDDANPLLVRCPALGFALFKAETLQDGLELIAR